MTNTNTKYQMVYKMSYAISLIQMGHKVLMTTPNPRKPELTAWIFEKDETFEEDFNKLLGKE